MKKQLQNLKIILILIICFFANYMNGQVIGAASDHSISLCSDNTVRTWGLNSWGELGNGTTPSTNANPIPVQVSLISGIKKIATGGGHSLALKNDGTVWAWGLNSSGELGDMTNINRTSPVQVSNLSNVVFIACGYAHSLAIKNDGTVWAWGANTYGQLGNGGTSNSITPVQVTGLTGVVEVAGGNDFSIAVKSDGTVWGWGNDLDGQLATHCFGCGSTSPIPISGLANIVSVACGYHHSLALKNDGTVWAWGLNNSGSLGNGSISRSDSVIQPHDVGNTGFLGGIKAIGCGDRFSLAVKNDGSLLAWGDNSFGALGNASAGDSWFPVQVLNINSVTSVEGGTYQSLATKSDGTVWAWGDNVYGELGDGTTTERTTTVQVSPLCTVLAINEEKNNLVLNIAPNPFSSQTTLSFSQEQKNVTIKILDVLGKEIKTETFSGKELILEKGEMQAGIYFVQITDGSTSSPTVINKKIVIQ